MTFRVTKQTESETSKMYFLAVLCLVSAAAAFPTDKAPVQPVLHGKDIIQKEDHKLKSLAQPKIEKPEDVVGFEKNEDSKEPEKDVKGEEPKKEEDVKVPKQDEDFKKPEEDKDIKKPNKDEDFKKPEEDKAIKKPNKDEDFKKPEEDKDIKKPNKDEDSKEPKKDEDSKESKAPFDFNKPGEDNKNDEQMPVQIIVEKKPSGLSGLLDWIFNHIPLNPFKGRSKNEEPDFESNLEQDNGLLGQIL